MSVCRCEGHQVESFVSDWLFFGVGSEIVSGGVWVEWKETVMGCDIYEWDGDV
jgi:hypothetical protein